MDMRVGTLEQVGGGLPSPLVVAGPRAKCRREDFLSLSWCLLPPACSLALRFARLRVKFIEHQPVKVRHERFQGHSGRVG